MIDYWSKLGLKEAWSKKERFNIIMNHIEELTSSADTSGNNSSTTPTEPTTEPEEPVVTTTANISVSVKDVNDNPISGATVTVSNGTEEYTGNTGRAGGCTVRNVPLGDYTVTTIKEDYIISEDDITVVEGENNLEIVLEQEKATGETNGLSDGEGE